MKTNNIRWNGLLLFAFLFSACSNVALSKLDIIATVSYIEVNDTIKQLCSKYGNNELLVVLDIDNTVLTSDTDLGSDIWYQWQRNKLDIKPTEQQIVPCLFEDAIGLLYELGTMNVTDTLVPTLINNWQQSGIVTFALTSRDPRYRAATERELLRRGIDFSQNALKPVGKPLPVYSDTLERAWSYMHGIMMTTGMDKGQMLNYLLQKTDRHFKALVFVDDSKKNVQHVKNQLEGKPMDVSIFHYQKIEQDRVLLNGGELVTTEQANKMEADWKALNQTLNSIFPGRKNECSCLTVQ